MELIVRDECPSTSSDPAVLDPGAPHGLIVAARSQTAGRGQRGNCWEAEPGKNLSFSMVIRPRFITAARQFVLSEAVALGIAGVLEAVLRKDGVDEPVTIKWPNDIYVGGRKICGILIENTLTGRRIDKSIAGIGININQRRFVGDAPNPVSLCQLTGREYELAGLLEDFASAILSAVDLAEVGETREGPAAGAVHSAFLSRLGRADGELHRWVEMPSGSIVDARIETVSEDGMLHLRHADGSCHSYAFKQISALL